MITSCSLGSRFDATEWKNADLEGRARADMLPDFLKRHHLKGMTRAEVVSLLGEPTATDKWDDADIVYVLGNDGTYFAIDNEWLLIDLDQHNRVISFKQVKD
jgi:hypothetical protein